MNLPCGVGSNQNVGNFSVVILPVSARYITLPPSTLLRANLSGFHAKIPCAVPFSISPSIVLKIGRPGSFALWLSSYSRTMNRFCCLANSRSSVSCASMLKTWRSSSSLDLRQYIKYLIIASGIKLIKGFALHRQFVISLYIGSCAFGTFQALLGEPPRSGGNAFGGIKNALAGLGGNTSPSPRLWCGRGQSFFKFGIVVIIPKSSDSFPAEPRMRHALRAWWLWPKSYARSKPHVLASTPATPKEKTLLAFLIWRG